MTSFKKIIHEKKFFLVGAGLLFFVVLVNAFPGDYVFSGGDTAQFIEAKDNIKGLLYDWEGRAILFYSSFALLDFFGISNTLQLSFYLAFFIFGSYISFYFFSGVIVKTSDLKKTVVALFYALNLFTLYAFTANWGFSYFLSLYVSIPVLVGVYLKYLKTLEKKYVYIFGIIIFLSSSGFGNSAFFPSFFLLLFILTLALALTHWVKISRETMKGLGLIVLISLAVSAFWIFPIIPQIRSGVERTFTENILEFNWIISHTANPILNTISLTHYSGDYFPYNFIYESKYFLKNIFIFLPFIPIFLITIAYFFYNRFKNENKKLFLSFTLTFIIFIILVARVAPPFETINHFLYNIWGMSIFRGYDKMAIYVPLLVATLILLMITEIKSRKVVWSIVFILLLISAPFFTGKIQQNLSYRFSNRSAENKDYKKSKYSFLVKIPQEYNEIRDRINEDDEKAFIATLPYSRGDNSGIVDYPKWQLYGIDITHFLYNKKLIEANGSSFPNWQFAKDFNDEQNNAEWIVKLLGMMNVKYIIYHKDAPEEYVAMTQEKMRQLEVSGLIKNIEDNDYFTLYEIDNQFILPYISLQKGSFEIEDNIESIKENFESLEKDVQKVSFREINPKKYEVDVKKADSAGRLILAETYNPLWRAYFIDSEGGRRRIEAHYKARGYANGWELKDIDNASRIVIEYYPIRLLWQGMIISGITILLLISFLLKYYYAKRKRVGVQKVN